jgi:hypothetical protein
MSELTTKFTLDLFLLCGNRCVASLDFVTKLWRDLMTETDDGRALPQAESIAGLGLVLISLAYYFSPGEERAKLVAWMERQAEIFEAGYPPDIVLCFRRFVESLRKGEGAELLKSAHMPEHGPH